MIDMETIGIEFKTDGLKAGQRELDKTTQAANRTADAADKVGNAAQRSSGQFRALESSLGTLRTVIGGLGLAVLTREFFGMADAVTTLNNQLKLATGSSAAAAQAYQQLYEIAQRSRVSFTELGGTYAAIARAGSQLGVSQNRLLTVTEAIGNAMTISGGSAASMQAALVQLSQGLSSGVLRGEELNSVMEQTPRLAKAIADGLGVPIGKLRELGAAGEITAEQVIKSLESQAKTLGKEVQGATLTVGQAYTQLGNAVTVFAGEADSATGASKALASAMSAVAGGITDIGKAAKEHQVAIATTLGIAGGAGLLAALPAIASGLKIVGVAIAGLGAVLAANPLVLALLGIGAAVGGFVAYNNAAQKSADGMRRTLKALEQDLNKRSIYDDRSPEGNARFASEVEKRKKAIQELRTQIAILDAQNLDTSAEDARLGRYNAQAIAQDALRAKLTGTMSAMSGVNDKYREQQAQLETLQQAYAAGMITEAEYLAAVGKISAALEKQYAGTKKVKSEEEQHREVMKGVIERREAFMAQHAPYQTALEMESIEIEHQNKLITANLTDLEKLTQTEYERANALEDEVKKQREANKAIGLGRLELAKLEASRLDDAAAEKTRLAVIMDGINPEIAAEYRRQAEALRLLAGEKVTGAYSEEMDAQRKSETTEWNRHWDQVSQGMVDSLMQGGKSVAEYLKGLFRTLVLRPVLSAVVNPAAAAFSGALGMPGAASAATSGVSALGGLGSIGSMLGGFGTAAGYGASALFAGNGLGALSGGMSMLGAGSISQGLGMIAGVAGPILAGVTLISSLIKSTKTPGEQHTGGFYSSSGATGMDAALGITDGNEAWARDMIKRANPEIESFVKTTVDSVVSATKANAKALGMDIALGIDAGFASNTNGKGKDKNNFGYFDITINGETVAEYMNRTLGTDLTQSVAQWTTDMADAAAKWVLGGEEAWKALARQGEGASATLDRMVLSLKSVNQMFDMLGHQIELVGIEGATAAAQFADLFGGLQQAQQAVSTYYSEFYSDAERSAYTTRMLTGELDKLGQQMPTTRDQFKGMVDAAIAVGDTDLAAKLIALSGAVASVLPAAVESFADAAMSQLKAAVDREKAYWQKQASAAGELKSEVEGIFGLLVGSIRQLRDEATNPLVYAQGGNQFINNAITAARNTGALPDRDELSNAIGAARGGLGLENFVSVAEQRFAQMELAGRLEILKNVAGDQLTEAESQLRVAQAQLELLDQTMEYWQDMLNQQQSEIDATLSVAEAVNQLADILDPTGAKRGTSKGGSGGNYIMGGAGGYGRLKDGTDAWFNQDHSGGTYRTTQASGGGYEYIPGLGAYVSTNSQDMHGDLSHLAAAQLTYAFNSPATDQVSTLQNLARMYGSSEAALQAVSGLIDPGILNSYQTIPAFAGGGVHSGGWAMVGEEGPELAFLPPARIYTAGQTGQMLGESSGGKQLTEVIYELKMLRDQVAELTSISQQSASALNGLGQQPMLVEIAS